MTGPPRIEGASIGSPRPIEDASPEGSPSSPCSFSPNFVVLPPTRAFKGCCMPFREILRICAPPFPSSSSSSSFACCAGLQSTYREGSRLPRSAGIVECQLFFRSRSRFCPQGVDAPPALVPAACPNTPLVVSSSSSSRAASLAVLSRALPKMPRPSRHRPRRCHRSRPVGRPPPWRPPPALHTPRERRTGTLAPFGPSHTAQAVGGVRPTVTSEAPNALVGAGSSRVPPLQPPSRARPTVAPATPKREPWCGATGHLGHHGPHASLSPSPFSAVPVFFSWHRDGTSCTTASLWSALGARLYQQAMRLARIWMTPTPTTALSTCDSSSQPCQRLPVLCVELPAAPSSSRPASH